MKINGPTALSSARLHLRLVTPADAEILFRECLGDGETLRYLQWPPHATVGETQALIATFLTQIRAREKWYYVARDEHGTPAGFASLKFEDDCRATLGFAVFRAHRRRGYATEMIRLLCEWALRLPEVFRVHAVCDCENEPSRRALERAGMEREGLLRRWAVHPNLGRTPRDVICFARVKQ